MDGAVVLDKPEGITSHAAVLRARRLLSESRIGHLGTLDPFATGVLVLLAGNATRLARFYRDREKTYRGTIRFGYSTDSFDCTGSPTSPPQEPGLDAGELRRLFEEFVGTFDQQPPPLSAKKVGGVRAYRLARKGEEPRLSPVRVSIQELELLSVEGPLAVFRARVSSGTYIRSLAHDLGARMGVGAHLAELRRTAAGEFGENEASDFSQLEDKVRQGGSSELFDPDGEPSAGISGLYPFSDGCPAGDAWKQLGPPVGVPMGEAASRIRQIAEHCRACRKMSLSPRCGFQPQC